MPFRAVRPLGFPLGFALGFTPGTDPLWPDPQEHDGISYDASIDPDNGGHVVIRTPGGVAQHGKLTDFFPFTGSAGRTFIGRNGLLQTAGLNIPRVEYIGADPRLFIEAARTNQLLQCRDQTNASWVKTTMTAALDQTGIDGAANVASSLTATAGNATSLQTIVQAAVASTFSFDIKRVTGVGTIGICQDGVTFTDVTAQINSSTFTRVTLTATQLNPILGIRLTTNGDKIAVDFGGFEAGTFASSRILTTTIAVARTADKPSRTYGSEYTQLSGTTYVEVDRLDATLAGVGIFGSGNTGRNAYITAAGGAKFGIYDGTTECGAAGAVSFVSNVLAKGAAAFDSNGMSTSFKGNTPVTSAFDGVFGAGETTIAIGDLFLNANSQLFGHIRRLDYWPTRLPDAVLQAMTA